MDISPDYEDLFDILNTCKIRYLVVGGQAMIFHSEPRYTKDMDVWIPADLNDPENVFRALDKFGAPLGGMKARDFKNKKMIFQIGVPPIRIDIMMGVPGVEPLQAWATRKKGTYGQTPINILDIKHLIQAKKKAGRLQDRLDIEKLVDRAKRFKRKTGQRKGHSNRAASLAK